jgi:hypothetical protein
MKKRGFKVVHLVPRETATTLPEYDAQAAKLIAKKLAAAKGSLTSRAVTWQQSDGKPDAEVLPWATDSTTQSLPSTSEATNEGATVPWYKKWFMP